MAECLQLLGPVELEDVGRGRLRLRRRHPPFNLLPAASSRKTSTGVDASRARLAGTSGVISPRNALATASAFASPATRNTMRLADWTAGTVSVTRWTNG